MVEDEEILYRSISLARNQCKRDEAGRWRLSSQAFSDRVYKPSVDRANLCNTDPTHAKKSEKDGVVSVVTSDVRAIQGIVQNDEKGVVIRSHVVDVIPDPVHMHATLPDNPAHALIVSNPDFQNQRVFRRLLERLQQLAEQRGWLIEPTE